MQKRSPDKKPRTILCQELENNTGRKGVGIRETDGPATGEPPGSDRYLITSRGQQRGVKKMQEAAADSGRRRREQSQVVEAGRW